MGVWKLTAYGLAHESFLTEKYQRSIVNFPKMFLKRTSLVCNKQPSVEGGYMTRIWIWSSYNTLGSEGSKIGNHSGFCSTPIGSACWLGTCGTDRKSQRTTPHEVELRGKPPIGARILKSTVNLAGQDYLIVK